MSIALPSRLAKDSSVLDYLNSKNPTFQGIEAVDVRLSGGPIIEEDDGMGGPANFDETLRNPSRNVLFDSKINQLKEKIEQPRFDGKAQHQHGVEEKAEPEESQGRVGGIENKAAEPRLESFASALDYVLQHLTENEEGLKTDRHSSFHCCLVGVHQANC